MEFQGEKNTQNRIFQLKQELEKLTDDTGEYIQMFLFSGYVGVPDEAIEPVKTIVKMAIKGRIRDLEDMLSKAKA